MTDTIYITPEQVATLDPDSFFNLLDMEGLGIESSYLRAALLAAPTAARQTKRFKFFKGYLTGLTLANKIISKFLFSIDPFLLALPLAIRKTKIVNFFDGLIAGRMVADGLI